MWIIWVVAIIAVLVMLKFVFGKNQGTCSSASTQSENESGCGSCDNSTDSDDALVVLRKRFANGEIDEGAFEKMKRVLDDGDNVDKS